MTVESYYEEMSKIDWVSKYYKVILPISFFGGIVLIAWNCIFAQLWNSPLLIVHSVLLALCMTAWASFKSFDRTAFVFNIIFFSFQIVNTVAIMIIEIISIIAIIDELIDLRKAKGLTQKELAKAANLTQSVIARLESKKATPQLDTLLKVAAALDCNLEVVPVPR